MNARAFIPVDKAAFYRFIATQSEQRYEFEGGRIVQQMTGRTLQDFRLAKRISDLVESQIEAAKWEVLRDWGIETDKTVRFGDVVLCPAGTPGNVLATVNPALIVEILSPSSLHNDLDRKPSEYLSLASLQAYIVASQDEAACLAWIRNVDGRFPGVPVEYGPNDLVAIPSLGIALSIADIYSGIIDVPPKDTPHG